MACQLSRRGLRTSTLLREQQQRSAAQHLFEQAEREERQESRQPQRSAAPTPDPDAWTGEERMQDQVLRMLVDSYKPLRVEGWSAKRQVQKPTERALDFGDVQPEQNSPASRSDHVHPWDCNFSAPRNYSGVNGVRPIKRIRPQFSKKLDSAARLRQFREKQLDRSMGGKGTKESDARQALAGPVSTWSNVVEDRIQRAIAEGQFKNINGRGKPFKRDVNESNPFLTRTEFLLNRLVHNQGAAPPWVDLQQQLDLQLATFRQTLRADWLRRAVRMITLPGLSPLRVPGAIALKAREFRDPEWVKRERGFHELNLISINNLTRNYNALAPASTRRGLYTLDRELEACFVESVTMLEQELSARLHSTPAGPDEEKQDNGYSIPAERSSMWQAFKSLIKDKPWTA